MSLRIVPGFLALSAFLLFGCNKTPTTNNNPTTTNTTSRTSNAGNVEKIGVPECDDFIAKYEACVADHVPEDQQTQFKENLAEYRRAWRTQAAASPGLKSVLPAVCKRHVDEARITMQPFGCDF
jgi:hypothetical protein